MEQKIDSQETNKRWLIIVTIMLVAILEVLDTTIVNVSLPAMMPALGASQDQITWVLTSYVVASAMLLPLTGFLSNRFGHKYLLLINITGFMISSMLCGLSTTLSFMIVFRLAQGAFGAALIPLSQAILRQSFPLEEQGKAMAIWGIGIMVAPVLGPTLGGYITEYASWRWIFYINIPICVIGFLLSLFVIPQTKIIKEKIDWISIVYMFIGVGCLQLFLDQGNNKDWFSSNLIVFLAALSTIGLTLFIWRSLTYKTPAINLKIFKDRNFAISTAMLTVYCGSLFGCITLQPIMLETLFHYDTITAGLTLSPMGIASAVGMVIASQLMTRINVKYLLVVALLLCASGSYYLSSLNLNAMQSNILYANSLFGLGMGLFMVPLSIYALATIAKEKITEASGLFSYGRMLGTSIGVSLLSTLVSRMTQTNWNELGVNISRLSNNLRLWLQGAHMTLRNQTTPAVLSQQLHAQASMIAFLDAYLVIAIAFILLIPFVLLMKTVVLKEGMESGN